ncbi:MAG: hypothetical protein KAR40_11310 [Candidatus Sabulitectum sp.]|nr:hypothetical protein [Candidatus Sabulitectum sp.]
MSVKTINISPWDLEFKLKPGSTNKFQLIFHGCPPTGKTHYKIVIHLDIWWATYMGEIVINAIKGLKSRMDESIREVQTKFKL